MQRPTFLTLQTLGAANDNFVKQAILVMIGFGLIQYPGPASLWTNAASGLFILPFLVLSTRAGRWVAQNDLRAVLIRVKSLEIGCAALACAGLLLGNVYLLLSALTLLGIQSAFFGPAKFSWPARTESSEDLPKVTGSIEALTFLAILLGSLIGGAMVENTLGLAILVMSTAMLGLLCAVRLPAVPVTDTAAVRRYTDQPQTLQARRLISWFWFLGASYLTQLPLLANDIMNLAPQQVSYLLAAFAVGVGVGSKLVPLFGNIALRLGISMMIAAGFALPWVAGTGLAAGLILLAIVGLAGGLYVVPLYVWMQQNLSAAELAQAIGLNNRLNAILMVASAGFGILALTLLSVSTSLYFMLLPALTLLWLPMAFRFDPSPARDLDRI